MYDALQERLILTLQDVKEWLGKDLSYTNVTVSILEEPLLASVVPDTIFFATIDGQKATFDSGATPTPGSVATGLVGAINALAIVGLTAIDDPINGTYTLSSLTAFSLYVSQYQSPNPIYPQDGLLEGLRCSALVISDEYINNPFADVDECGVVIEGTEQEIPKPLTQGVLQVVSWLLAEQANASVSQGNSSSTSGPKKRHRTGEDEIEYATAGDAQTEVNKVFASVGGLPTWIKSILRIYRYEPGWNKRRKLPARKFRLTDMRDGSGALLDSSTVVNINV